MSCRYGPRRDPGEGTSNLLRGKQRRAPLGGSTPRRARCGAPRVPVWRPAFQAVNALQGDGASLSVRKTRWQRTCGSLPRLIWEESVKGGCPRFHKKKTRNRNLPKRAFGARGSSDSRRAAPSGGKTERPRNPVRLDGPPVPRGRPAFTPPDLVPKGGLEPPRDNSHTPLKRTCLPFHHFGSGEDRRNSLAAGPGIIGFG